MYTLNQIVKLVKKTLYSHALIKSVHYGNVESLLKKRADIVFPACLFTLFNSSTQSKKEFFSFRFFLIDVLDLDNPGHVLEIHSDSLQVSNDIIAKLSDQSAFDWMLDEAVSKEMIEDDLATPDPCAGLTMTLTLSQGFRVSRCAVPLNMLAVMDSEKLRGRVFDVRWIKLSGEKHVVGKAFTSKEQFVVYLNTVFRPAKKQEGYYEIVGNGIEYLNIENYNQIEVMAIINWIPVTVEFDELTTEYQNNDLIGAELDPRMMIDNQPAQVGYGAIGFNPDTGTVSALAGQLLSLSYLPAY